MDSTDKNKERRRGILLIASFTNALFWVSSGISSAVEGWTVDSVRNVHSDMNGSSESAGSCQEGSGELKSLVLDSYHYADETFSFLRPCSWKEVKNLNPEYGKRR
jgi:hypothetical protein